MTRPLHIEFPARFTTSPRAVTPGARYFWTTRTGRLSKRQRRLHQPSLKSLLAGVDSKAARNQALTRAYLEHGYTLAESGSEVGLQYATISRIIKSDDGIS